jgi:hypothetical protein
LVIGRAGVTNHSSLNAVCSGLRAVGPDSANGERGHGGLALVQLRQFSSSSAYDAMFLGQSVMEGAKQLWKARAPAEYKFFFWLANQDSCWTNERRHKHGLIDNATYALCLQHEEEIDHLLLGCVYSHEVCYLMLSRSGWQELSPMVQEATVTWWLRALGQIVRARKPAFDSLVLLVGWGYLVAQEQCNLQ